ncbi:MAG TPA: hypothetical protein VJN96_26330 [Vicinamibacterales bacterium]|nr:hypothetical protein [Vicinamibacterales bacterium]
MRRVLLPLVVLNFLIVAASSCGHTDEELVLPWCKYLRVTSPGGTGMWAGSTHTEVHVRRSLLWSTAFDGHSAPGRPIVVTPDTLLVPISGGSRFLRLNSAETPLACGDAEAAATVPPRGGVVDCVDFLTGPARGLATALRVRRINAAGALVRQQEFRADEPGRVFLSPSLTFYDDDGTPYLVTFRDPWARTLPDGTLTAGTATPEQLQNIHCELIVVGPAAAPPLAAPQGHTVSDCSSAEVWGRVLHRPLRSPWR